MTKDKKVFFLRDSIGYVNRNCFGIWNSGSTYGHKCACIKFDTKADGERFIKYNNITDGWLEKGVWENE